MEDGLCDSKQDNMGRTVICLSTWEVDREEMRGQIQVDMENRGPNN